MAELKRGNVTVELVDIGEGLSGTYNPDDPNDVKLLRFYVILGNEDVEDASYCTLVPATATLERQEAKLKILMDAVYERVSTNQSVKKICERLSWMSLDDDNGA